ncbi:MAG: carbonic anhydrase [Desulfomicrobiaceae bacterium]|jgi:carbonic anhydrase|nr:carbonic anhydrase [Desulfomicrobiaceae bacterium]
MHRFSALLLAIVLLAMPASLWATADGEGSSPAMALQRLQEGNARFQEGRSLHPNLDTARRLVTSTLGQKPFATVLACSDSRVPVEIVFDQGIGDIFTIKVAGNVADTDEIGSMEYGVDHLGTPVLVVLGHTHCGAVTAVTTGAEVHGSIPQLVDNIIPALEATRHAHPELEGNALIDAVIEANVWQTIEDIFKRSPAIAKRAAQGKTAVVGAIYDITSGQVRFLGEHPNQAALLAAVPADPHGGGDAHTADTQGHATAPHQEEAMPAAPVQHAESAAGHGAGAPQTMAAAHATPAQDAHAPEAGHEAKSGGLGFFSFLLFVAALIGVVILLDKTILRPEDN